MPEHAVDEKGIFLAALEQATQPQREAYIQGACAGDPELLNRVKELLSVHQESQGPLDAPPPGVGIPPTIDEPAVTERPGTVIGPYKLLEQIGEGGFGVVFMAEQQQPIRRKVALKVLKPGMDTRQVIARFEAERQALALMDHPNIAKVHDGGVTSGEPGCVSAGRPYFVMELVKGIPITDYCDQNHVPVRERLELFVHVCQAVQHAHQKGIIHRDIKPTNVLVTLHDGTPVPKIIDFGIAKAMGQQLTDKTLFTNFAQLIGTPLYMSPEQAALSGLDVDTRSDIYSLGVMLYELLTGTTPFDKERFSKIGYGEICRIIREEEPPKPSTRISTLHSDSRTQSRAAHAVSGSDQPLTTVRGSIDTIAAQRKSDPKRLSQLFRGELDWIVMKALEKDRNRRYESASAFAADVQRYLHDEPVQACPPSAAYRLRKFARRNKTGLAVAGVVLLFIVFLGGGAGWVVRDKAARQAQTTSQVQELLTDARGLLADNEVPRARQKLAEAKSRIGNDRAQLGSLSNEVESLDTELERFERFLELVEKAHEAEFPQPVRQQGTGAERDRARAVPFLLEALSCYGVLEQDDWSVRVEAGLLGPDQVTRVRRTVYEELLWLADDTVRRWQVHGSGQSIFSAPGAAARAALAYLHQAETAGPRTSGFYEIRARCRYAQDQVEAAGKDLELARQTPGTMALEHYLLGLAAYDAEDKAEALQQFQAALRVEPTHYWSLLWMGHTLAQLGEQKRDWLAAAAVYTGCIMKRPEHAAAYLGRGNVFWKLKRAAEAEADYRAALRLQADLAEAHDNLGLALDKQGKLDEAIAEYQKAIAEYGKLKSVDYVLAELHWNLGTALNKQGKRDEALAEYHKQFGSIFPVKHLDEAIEAYRQAIKLDPKFALAHYYLGKALLRTNKPGVGTPVDEAIAEYHKAIKLDPKLADAYVDLGGLLLGKERYAEAVTAYRRGHELGAKQVGGYSSADLLRMAEQEAALVVRLPKILKGEDQPSDAERLRLAKLCDSKQRYAAAARFYTEAFAARPDPNSTPETRPNMEDRRGAAIAAMRAASGQGVDAALDDAERARLRWQALDWLRAHVAACPTLEKEPSYGHKLAWRLYFLLIDHDFVIVREPEELAELPEPERQAWQQLWNDLADMLKWTQRWAGPEKKQDDWNLPSIMNEVPKYDPKNPEAHINLGVALSNQNKLEEAIACYRKAIALDPKNAEAHVKLGVALSGQNKLEEAIAELRKAAGIDPKSAVAHYNLGILLLGKGDSDGAVGEYRAALEIDPESAEVHCNFGHALISQGHFQQAVVELRRGHELGARKPDWSFPSGQWLRNAERLTQLEPRLPGLLKGETQAADSAERLVLAFFAYKKQLYAAAARFYGEAFVADPKLGENLDVGYRFEAAGAAARAGCGRGQDDAQLNDEERAQLRGQALNWLRADVEAWSKLLSADGTKAVPAVQARMRHWLWVDFAGLRGADALAKLPDTERAQWQKLWADVDNLLKQVPLQTSPSKPFDHKLHLAGLYQKQGNYNKAETLFQEVLQAAEAAHGADHLFTLRCKYGLAQHYFFQGKYALAETLYQDVLQGETAKLGPDHRDVLDTKGELARVYLEQGKYDRAEPILEKVVEALTASKGANHLDTLFYKGSLANLYRHRENYDRAEILYQEVVEALTAQLGADHPETLVNKHGLALVYFDQGKNDRAEQLLQQVLQAQKEKLPPDHPGNLSTKKQLGSVYLNQGKYDQAEPLFREVLEKRTAKLGADHDRTLDSKHGLARLYYAEGQYAKAEPLFREAIEATRRTLGIEHPDTQLFTENLALCYHRMKRPDKAEDLLRELVDHAKQHTGADSQQYANLLAALGLPLLEQNRPAEAEKVVRESLAISEKKKSESWKTFNARSLLGGALLAQKKYADAEPFLLQGYEGMKEREAKIRRMDRVALIEALERLVQLYDAWGKKQKAEEWQKKLGAERAGK